MASPVHVAAVDLGATSGRVIVGSWARQRLVLTEVHRFPNQSRPLAGHDYWDLPYLWQEAGTGLLRAKQRFPKLASVGVDGWAVDHVLVNRSGRPVGPVHAYRDGRTLGLSAGLARRGIERVYRLTGIPNYSYNTSLQLRETLRAFPGISRLVERCLFIPDYFNFLLSGRMENELSIASHSQLLDVHGRNWSAEALGFFGIPPGWFSPPARSPRKLGPVSGLPGLKGAAVVLVPGHDTACAFAAMPAAPDGTDLYLSSGTWSLLGFESAAPLLGPAALAERVSNERMGDGGYRPLRSCPGLWLLERTLSDFRSRPRTAAAWAEVVGQAGRAPAPPVLLNLADPGLFNPPSLRDAIDRQLARRGAQAPRNLPGYVRLICASLGRGHAEGARVLERLVGRKFNRILMVGGGARNRLLCQATANAARMPVVALSGESTAIGNIGSQLIALGEVESLASFRRHLAAGRGQTVFQPRL